MIVTKVKNLNKKSFKEYSGPITEFNEVNIIFGYNGKGKTSLATGIIEEVLKGNVNDIKNYRFFNQKYVTENLLLSQSDESKIKGVTANFGKTLIDIEKNIEETENLIVNIEPFLKNKKNLEAEIEEEINEIFKTKKGNTKINKIKYENIYDLINIYENFIEDALKIEHSKERLLKIEGSDSLEKELQQKEMLIIPELNYISSKKIEKASNIFQKNFVQNHIPSYKIIQWLNDGLELHKEHKKCEFCGSIINLEDIKFRIEKYNLDDKQKSKAFLFVLNKELNEFNNQLEIVKKNQKTIQFSLKANLSNDFDTISLNHEIISFFIKTINEKINNIAMKVTFESEKLLKVIDSSIASFKNIQNSKENEINLMNKMIKKTSLLIKGSVGLEIRNNSLINKKMRLLNEIQSKIVNIEKENKTYFEKINILRNSKTNKTDFAEHLSQILENLEINLQLVLIEGDYLLKHSMSDSILTLSDISEGEKNLLGLLYFYYELFIDKEQNNLKSEIDIIVIDDPISSIDDSNKMYILSLLKDLITKKINKKFQLFILTHVWDDFCNLSYSSNNNKKISLFEIKKNQVTSYIEEIRTIESPYKQQFKEIYNFSKNGKLEEMSDCEMYHYPNAMRKILEEFLNFKCSKEIKATQGNINTISKVLCGENISNNDRKKISVLLNVCNILSHKISRHPKEILDSAKFLMSKIKITDKLHYDSNKT
ncbi:hypothetical protein MENTO_v1c03110 [Mesoplasma entomophilum]|uniref:Protein CR006 P-loop domain-containing protein n=1 Tax=Mesoplasma entomophilum TaxID=2149 RepID=A0A3S5XZI2_9MOLU|nr:AAA family ATPase [Mesoplasma entomophilum]ATQ35457.1 hypothetical protein CS528_01610 [Mesoplasma entomophilum]ATZ19417.1 hypothetical protein MENTO_v1c03110 [Mesoplasma entomophilum]